MAPKILLNYQSSLDMRATRATTVQGRQPMKIRPQQHSCHGTRVPTLLNGASLSEWAAQHERSSRSAWLDGLRCPCEQGEGEHRVGPRLFVLAGAEMPASGREENRRPAPDAAGHPARPCP
ncbi:unnamed protein product [Diplocarpon coronariae]